jgi:predicted aminopeptidase
MLTDRRLPLARRALLAALLAALPLLHGCAVGYLFQAARGEVALLAQRRPIERVIADPATAEPLRRKLEAVREIRRFAVDALALPDNASYRSYADIRRPYVVWNVVAAPEFSVEPLRWCFPVAGCVAYRGYFHEGAARSFADGLRARGEDAFVAGVPAYSTLGRFADPLLSSMVGYGVTDLAALVFHELAHQIVYVPGDSQFNEAFAVTVEDTGVERWLAQRRAGQEILEWHERRERQREFVALFARTRSELARLYAMPLAREEMRRRKRESLDAAAESLRELEARYRVHTSYEQWLAQGLNNAHLASVATYFDCVGGFQRLLAEQQGDLPRFYEAVKRLARRDAAERRSLCAASPR